jgi:CRP-like cAMP-binding protein
LVEDRSPQALTAVALAPSRVVEIRIEELDKAERKALLPLAVALLARQVRERENKAAYLRTASASQRVAGCLCDLLRLTGRWRDECQASLLRSVLTQQKMAEYVGCARDAVSKALASFVRSGWVELSASHIDVVDLRALHSYSGHLARNGRCPSWERSGSQFELADGLSKLVIDRQRAGCRGPARGAA